MTYLIEQLINGICQGAIYALFAIGYTIIVGVVGLVSFTFGEVIMIGAFAALFTATLTGGNILLTILFSFAASGLIGIVIHKICYEKFFESARYIPLICTIGMSMLIKNTVQILFGSETKAMPEVIPLGGIQIGNYRITYVQCTVMVVVTVLCILSEYRMVVYALIIIGMMWLRPQGIAGSSDSVLVSGGSKKGRARRRTAHPKPVQPETEKEG